MTWIHSSRGWSPVRDALHDRRSMGRIRCVVLALTLPLAVGLASAANVAGVEVEEAIDVGGVPLQLNGAGLRTKLFIKLYVASLYTPAGDGDARAIMLADEPMAITLDIVSDRVTRDKMIDALNDGFVASTGGDTAPVQDGIDAMLGAMSDPIEEGIGYTLAYEPGVGTRMSRNGEEKVVIEGLAFKQALFGIWLSDKPVQGKLKSGMLGS